MEYLLKLMIKEADRNYDGHFTLMKFTTNWRCCFGTVGGENEIRQMAEGKTPEEAMFNALNENVNVYEMEKEIKESLPYAQY